MVLILDLIAILFIVVLSFCCCSNILFNNDKTKNNSSNSSNSNNTTCILSHIVVGLSVIVYYKLVRYFKLTDKIAPQHSQLVKESFDGDISQSINDFITSSNLNVINTDSAASLSAADFTEYNNKLTTLIDNINDLKTHINSPPSVASPANMSSMDLAAQQQYQMFQINYLQDQVNKAKDNINSQTIANSSINYKPIKVFSSCVVANANGSTSAEQPFVNVGASQIQQHISPLEQQMLTTITQANTTNITKPGNSFSPQTGALGSFITNLGNFSSTNIH